MTHLTRICLGLIFISSLAACVSSPTADKHSSEKLLAEPPPGWNLIYRLNNITSRLSEFVPRSESSSDWSTKLSFESFLELASIDPIEVLLTEVEQDKKRCNSVQHFNLYSGLENSYPSSVRLFLCGEVQETQTGEVKMIKAIQGNDYLYIISIVKKIELFEPGQAQFTEKDIAAWSTYLRGISLCDNGDEAHSCPQTVKE